MHQSPKPAFIGCDWGSSNFRLALIGFEGTIIEVHSDAGGIVTLRKSGSDTSGLVAHLRKGLDALKKASRLDLSNLPLIISGMAGSSIGICEVPYLRLPFSLDGIGIRLHKTDALAGIGNQVYIIPGVCSDDDVMRGEETEAMGLMADMSLKDALLILPGTHSKHLWVSNGFITRLKTYMTGELFQVISGNTILSQSIVDPNDAPFDDQGKACFMEGMQMARSADLMHELFTLRSRVLLKQVAIGGNIHRLSGLLIGTELLQLDEMCDVPVILGGAGQLYDRYRFALVNSSVADRFIDISSLDRQLAVWRGHRIFHAAGIQS